MPSLHAVRDMKIGTLRTAVSKSSRVDEYGDFVAAMTGLPGDGQRRVHNEIVRYVANICQSASLACHKEPRNTFGNSVPLAVLDRFRTAHPTDPINADLIVHNFPTDGFQAGVTNSGMTFGEHTGTALIEVKGISFCKTRLQAPRGRKMDDMDHSSKQS